MTFDSFRQLPSRAFRNHLRRRFNSYIKTGSKLNNYIPAPILWAAISRAANKTDKAIANEINLWDGVTPPTWTMTEVTAKCVTIYEEDVAPIFQFYWSTDERYRPIAYISFSACFNADIEPWHWLGGSKAKILNQDGSNISPAQARAEGFGVKCLCKNVNV